MSDLAANSKMLVTGDAGEDFMKGFLNFNLDDILKD